jgi:hypothetical protein
MAKEVSKQTDNYAHRTDMSKFAIFNLEYLILSQRERTQNGMSRTARMAFFKEDPKWQREHGKIFGDIQGETQGLSDYDTMFALLAAFVKSAIEYDRQLSRDLSDLPHETAHPAVMRTFRSTTLRNFRRNRRHRSESFEISPRRRAHPYSRPKRVQPPRARSV